MKKCPLLNKKCIEHECEWWIHLQGMNPQTGQPTDEWGCSIAWLPLLMIENAGINRQVKASLDRNNNVFFSALPEHVQKRVQEKNNFMIQNGNGNVR